MSHYVLEFHDVKKPEVTRGVAINRGFACTAGELFQEIVTAARPYIAQQVGTARVQCTGYRIVASAEGALEIAYQLYPKPRTQ